LLIIVFSIGVLHQEKGGRKDLEEGFGEMEGKGTKMNPDPLKLYFVKYTI
jgi:hypothetical protein